MPKTRKLIAPVEKVPRFPEAKATEINLVAVVAVQLKVPPTMPPSAVHVFPVEIVSSPGT